MPQSVQQFDLCISCGTKDSPSGLWHHIQRSGQPFRKTVVLSPGPSCTAISLMSKIKFKEGKKEAAPAPAAAPVQKKFSVDDIKDEDMMVAALVATADFIEETKKTEYNLRIRTVGRGQF
mgnify:CR=1 FL=1